MKVKKLILCFLIISIVSSLAYAQVWSNLGNRLTYPVNSMIVYNNNLYAANYGVAMRNSSDWVDMSNGSHALFGSGDVYAGSKVRHFYMER